MFGWFKSPISKTIPENVPEDNLKKEIVEIDNYVKDRAFFEEKNKEKIEEYEKRLHEDSKFREGDVVKTIYPNSPEMLVTFVDRFRYCIWDRRHENKFKKDNTVTRIIDYSFHFSVYEPKIYASYHDGNYKLTTKEFTEEMLTLISRKEV